MTCRPLSIAICSIAAALCASCSTNSLVRQDRVRSQPDFGTTSVTVLSVLPWEEVQSKMSPRFRGASPSSFSGTDALRQVAPLTLASVERAVRNQSLGLEAVGPTLSGTKTSSLSAAGEKSVVSTETRTVTAPGTPERPPTGEAKDSAASIDSQALKAAMELIERDANSSGSLQVDPFLKYLAATALVQEVNLLNEYVSKPAFTLQDYVPYVLRVQIALQPRRTTLPYDTYCTVAAFPSLGDSTTPTFGFLATVEEAGTTSALVSESTVNPLNGLRLLPLVATDSIDSAIRSTLEAEATDAELRARASAGEVGVGVRAQAAIQHARQIASRRVNSTLTIGGMADNSVRIRLGAQAVGPEEYVAVPRTHYATFLVLVPTSLLSNRPDGTIPVTLVTRVEHVDAVTGESLAPTNWSRRGEALRVRAGAALGDGLAALTRATATQLVDAALNNDPRAFGVVVQESKSPHLASIQGMLWVEALEVARSLPYNISRVPFSVRSGIPDLVENSTIPVTESGEGDEKMYTTVIRGTNLTDLVTINVFAYRDGRNDLVDLIDPIALERSATSDRIVVRFPAKDLKDVNLDRDSVKFDATLSISNVRAVRRTYVLRFPRKEALPAPTAAVVPPPTEPTTAQPPKPEPEKKPDSSQWTAAFRFSSFVTVINGVARLNFELRRSDLMKDEVEQLSMRLLPVQATSRSPINSWHIVKGDADEKGRPSPTKEVPDPQPWMFPALEEPSSSPIILDTIADGKYGVVLNVVGKTDHKVLVEVRVGASIKVKQEITLSY